MTGIDCNILVQLALADHPMNQATTALVRTEVQKGYDLVLPPHIVTEFLHVVTDDRRFTPPFTMPEAVDWIEDFLARPNVRVLEPTQMSLQQTFFWMREFKLGRKRILDTHFAAILHSNGVNRLITSNPADFTVFDVFEIVTP